MKSLRTASLVLAILTIGAATRAEAQLSYTVQNVQQIYQPGGSGYTGGFTATIAYRNINNYGDPLIISFWDLALHSSQRVIDFCNTYGLSQFDCSMGGAGGNPKGIQGNVQTGTIPIGSSFWTYSAGLGEDSCLGFCFNRGYEIGGPGTFGVLGCQAPAPTPDFYAGRTCDADGYTGSLFLTAQFTYSAPSTVPVFVFDNTDVTMTAVDIVWPGPNAFVQPTTAPEPSTWLLMATGLGMVGLVARRRREV